MVNIQKNKQFVFITSFEYENRRLCTQKASLLFCFCNMLCVKTGNTITDKNSGLYLLFVKYVWCEHRRLRTPKKGRVTSNDKTAETSSWGQVSST